MRYAPLLLLFLLSLACHPTNTPADGSSSADPDKASFPIPSLQCVNDSIHQQYALFLTIADIKIKLADLPTCEIIPKSAYQNHHIPDSAYAAAMSWHAGAYFFLAKKEEVIQVYRAIDDENQSQHPDFKLFAVYANEKFSFQER